MGRPPKHIPKTREQLIAELKSSDKWKEKMLFAKTKFYPALCDLDTNVDDTKVFLTSINSVMMEKVIQGMKTMKFGDLKLAESLDPKDADYEGYVKLLNLFNEMTAYDAKDLIEGMRNEIATFENDLMKNTKLINLPVKWLDEI